jgi:hypothetical protein
MLEEVNLNEQQVSAIFDFIQLSDEKNSLELLEYFSTNTNELLQE